MDELERAAGLDLTGLDHGERWAARTSRASELAAELCQVQADLVAFTQELIASSGWAGDGVRSPEHWLQVYTNLGHAQARQLVRVAERAADLAPVTDRMRVGTISLDQAAVISRHLPADSPVETMEQVAHLAEAVTCTQLARVVASYHFDRTRAPHEETRDKPEHRPATLTVHRGADRYRLVYDCDLADGALVDQALREGKDALFTAGNPDATLADGLLEACRRSLESVSSEGRRDQYRILVHLDTAGHGWLGRTGALPDTITRLLSCDGRVSPVWETEGTPVRMGRSRRIVPRRVRGLVEDRDRGCRYPGCAATGFLENHHLVHWRDGGPTDPDNLISLCPHHHREHHRGRFVITGTPTRPDGLVFITTWGRPISRPAVARPATTRPDINRNGAQRARAVHPHRLAPRRTALRGERLDLGSINLNPENHQPRLHRRE
ncbi:HNH endonuclease [Aestuariimicrobium soli]|uniref:HNH endonuclease signature motif containing protein n=1 Tax=Aestuariimicrobium soli TaxID=2035834 RepID=UPI003EC02018